MWDEVGTSQRRRVLISTIGLTECSRGDRNFETLRYLRLKDFLFLDSLVYYFLKCEVFLFSKSVLVIHKVL